jgi:hypothetical protein
MQAEQTSFFRVEKRKSDRRVPLGNDGTIYHTRTVHLFVEPRTHISAIEQTKSSVTIGMLFLILFELPCLPRASKHAPV